MWPASSSTTASYDSTGANQSYPPAGAVLRVKSSFSTAGRSANVTKLINALKTYGAAAHIRAGADVVRVLGEVGVLSSAERSEFNAAVELSDCEFVDISSLMISSSSYEVDAEGEGVTEEAPHAQFTQNKIVLVRSGLIIVNDTSTNTPTSWTWDFGDSE
jgi:hypothetical protein